MATISKKINMQDDVFSGISAVFATADELPDGLDLSAVDFCEFPVSDDSGFNFDTGQASIEHFKVKGLNADWVNTFTPGEGEIKLEIPCHDTNIMDLVGMDDTDVTVTLPTGMTTNGTSATGKAYSAPQKAVYLGLVILNDTEDKIFFIKKGKFSVQVINDGSNKPLCVVLTGSIAKGSDPKAIGICDIAAP
jgi:hypothetical protein